MARLLIVFGTTEGQTAKIAERIGARLQRRSHDVTLCRAEDAEDQTVASCDGIVAGGSLHMGRHQRALRRFVARHAARLRSVPSAFFSVSLAAASRTPEERRAAFEIAERLAASADWRPEPIASFAGALRYSRYGWLKGMLMRRIAAKEGGETDTRRDVEYTDWDEVNRFTDAFAARVERG